jgi:hypothetical protein
VQGAKIGQSRPGFLPLETLSKAPTGWFSDSVPANYVGSADAIPSSETQLTTGVPGIPSIRWTVLPSFRTTVFFHAGRVILIKGRPWWVALDVCLVLGLENVSRAVDRLDDDEIDDLTN